MSFDLLAAIAILATIVLVRIRIVPENQRFVVLSAGNFLALKGPGLVFVTPSFNTRWIKIKVGDRGILTSNGLALINRINVPVSLADETSKDHRIQVIGFEANRVVVDSDAQ